MLGRMIGPLEGLLICQIDLRVKVKGEVVPVLKLSTRHEDAFCACAMP